MKEIRFAVEDERQDNQGTVQPAGALQDGEEMTPLLIDRDEVEKKYLEVHHSDTLVNAYYRACYYHNMTEGEFHRRLIVELVAAKNLIMKEYQKCLETKPRIMLDEPGPR